MRTILFGKLPTEGDYIRAGDDRPLLDFLDIWLTAAWADFVLTADVAWEDRYRVSPLWWFAAPFEHATVCGVICPSLDSVGRLFPMVVAARCPIADVGAAMRHQAHWLSAVQDALIEALEPPGQTAAGLLESIATFQSSEESEPVCCHRGFAGLQPFVTLESKLGWRVDAVGAPIASGPRWSLWQAASFEGVTSQAALLDGWPSAFAIGQLLAADPGQLSRAHPTADVIAPEGAVFRVDVGETIPVVAQGSEPAGPHSGPILIQGSRGVAAVIARGDELPGIGRISIAIRDLLGSVAKSPGQLFTALEQLATEVDSAAIVCKLRKGWAIAETGSGLVADLVGNDHLSARPAYLRLRTWPAGLPAAVQIRLGNDASGDGKRGVAALLSFRKDEPARQRRIALIESA